MLHSDNKDLFKAKNGIITYNDVVQAIKQCVDGDCDVLFVHSDISFGIPVKGVTRRELKELLVDSLIESGVKTIIFPTFTFSFCNREDYDIQNSHTEMGMLPDYVRTRTDAVRSDDPIMSVAIIGDKEGFDHMDGRSSCGVGGIFHQLHNSRKKVEFLFFGTSVTKCFTFLHYVEEIKRVPYRYSKEFSGRVIDNGVSRNTSVDVYVRYKDVKPTLPSDFEPNLLNMGIEKKVRLGDSWVSSVKEDMAYDYISSLIENDIHVFSIMPESGELIKEYEYGNVTTM